ncbi:transglutaminase family protein [Frigidibacter sp. ROC022]|uniref:transglutaminase family protein n=1 Tax=Frigidibacter sp. ROC022 TaxID=2971796 RepID=UPI00215A2A59|nr:transglutaminase family protein [Frigidibacter sp. ROC022]MCR8725405.1 transglutaminase family protein [Frigidibacter sp. ROC022]
MAQLYDIALEFGYRYEQPASMGRHVLRLLPLNLENQQQLVAGEVSIDPRPDDRRDGVDFFGNARTEIAYDRPISGVTFRLQARVQRTATAPQFDLSPALERLGEDLALARNLAPGSPHHFTGNSDRVQTNPAMTAYAREALSRAGTGPLTAFQAVQAVGRALHRDMTFDPKATDVDTDADEAFKARRGVCQDFSHIMIACLRGIGVPAGYVSGFLRTIPPPGTERLEGADAMHAWVQAWCGTEMGWVQFDPTNDLLVASDHVVTALGRDYADVAPIRGQLRASGSQKTSQKVDVIPL